MNPNEILAEAQKMEKKKGFFGGNKKDEAAELYGKAGNAFKLKKQMKEAGDAYMKQGEMMELIGERDESSSCYINASKCYKTEFPKGEKDTNVEAVNALKLGISILTEKGRFSSAASHQKQIAEILETDIGDIAASMEAYEIAADWYSGEDSTAQANGCLLKVAQFAATLKDYEKAIDLFERVSSKSLGNNLTKWSVREYLFKAMICVLCLNDHVRFKTNLSKYQGMDSSFSGTRECALIEKLIQAIENNDSEEFSQSLAEFDRMTKLDDWKTSLLLLVKRNIQSDGEEDYT